MENNTNNAKKTQDKVKKTDKNNDSNKKNKLTEEENSNTHSQKTSPKDQDTQDQVEKIIDTERIPNKEESIFANLCGNTSNNKTDNKKTLDEKLNNYFDSKETKITEYYLFSFSWIHHHHHNTQQTEADPIIGI